MGKLEKGKLKSKAGQSQAGKIGSKKTMTSGLAQARSSSSQRCYRDWDQDLISAWCDTGSGFNTSPI